MRNNKSGGYFILFISLLIASIIEDVIYSSTGLSKYNMFLDGFSISKFLFELLIFAISFFSVYYLAKSIRNIFSR